MDFKTGDIWIASDILYNYAQNGTLLGTYAKNQELKTGIISIVIDQTLRILCIPISLPN